MREWVCAATLSFAMFCRMLGVFMALPVAAVFAARLGADSSDSRAWIIGLAVGGYGATQAMMQIPAGMLADRIGRKPVLLAALSLFIVGSLLCAFADNVWILIAGRLLQGTAAVAAVISAWIGDATTAQNRGAAMMMFGGAIGLAFMVSLLVAPPLAGRTGIGGVFAAAAILGGAAFLAVAVLPSPLRPAAAPLLLRQVLQNRALLAIAGGGFVLHYAMAAVFLHLPLALTVSLQSHWKIYAPAFLLSLPVALPLVVWVNKYRLAFSLAIALTLGGALVLFGGNYSPLVAGGGLFLFFAGFVALEAILPTRATFIVAANGRATALGVVMTAEFLGIFLGGLAGGVLVDLGGAKLSGAAVVLLLAAWCVIVTVNLLFKKEKKWQKAV